MARAREPPPLAEVLMLVAQRTALLWAMGLVRRHARTPLRGADLADVGLLRAGLFAGVSRAVRALLPDIAVPTRQGCCGALHAHNGESEKGRELARRLGEQLTGIIVTTPGGCAGHLAGVLGRDRVHELSEHLAATGATPDGEL